MNPDHIDFGFIDLCISLGIHAYTHTHRHAHTQVSQASTASACMLIWLPVLHPCLKQKPPPPLLTALTPGSSSDCFLFLHHVFLISQCSIQHFLPQHLQMQMSIFPTPFEKKKLCVLLNECIFLPKPCFY